MTWPRGAGGRHGADQQLPQPQPLFAAMARPPHAMVVACPGANPAVRPLAAPAVAGTGGLWQLAVSEGTLAEARETKAGRPLAAPAAAGTLAGGPGSVCG